MSSNMNKAQAMLKAGLKPSTVVRCKRCLKETPALTPGGLCARCSERWIG